MCDTGFSFLSFRIRSALDEKFAPPAAKGCEVYVVVACPRHCGVRVDTIMTHSEPECDHV